MKNLLLLTALVVYFLVIFPFSKGIMANEDLCGGTRGNGRIINVDNNAFTLKRNDGTDQLIRLTKQAEIKTSEGIISLSYLKIGDRVTLVGGPNRDGSFAADYVVVCNADKDFPTNQLSPIPRRNENTNYKKISEITNVSTIILFSLFWFGMSLFLRFKKGASLTYLLFFTIFYVYVYKVLDYTLLQFQTLLLIRQFVPGLILNGVSEGMKINAIPLFTLKLEDIITSLLNILLFLPFGFGLPFITNFRLKKVILFGFIFSTIIETTQLISGYIANTTFRIADVNDLIFNTLGVLIGFILFENFVRIFRKIIYKNSKRINPLFQYIADRPNV